MERIIWDEIRLVKHQLNVSHKTCCSANCMLATTFTVGDIINIFKRKHQPLLLLDHQFWQLPVTLHQARIAMVKNEMLVNIMTPTESK